MRVVPTRLNPQRQPTRSAMNGLTRNSPYRANFAFGLSPVSHRSASAGLACDPVRGFSASRRLLEQTESTGTLDRPAPAVNLKLGVDMPDVNFNRIHRKVKLMTDFP